MVTDENPPNCGYPHGDCVLSAYIDDLRAQLARAAPVLAAAKVYEDRWENGTDPEVGDARTALFAAAVAWRAAREGA